MSAVLEAALAYAAHGWPVLPLCGPERRVAHPGKEPWIRGWQHLCTTDFDTIRSWWRQRPDSNVGIAAGPRSGLAVIDVDPQNGGTESLAELEVKMGVLPGTVTSMTGGGGVHLLYRHPGGKVGSGVHKLGPGLDVKADVGHQFVAPPSVHRNGQRYAWLGGVWDHGVTAWPAAQLPVAAVKARETALPPMTYDQGRGMPARRLAGLVQTVMDGAEGERNSRLHWAACRGAEMVTAGTLPAAVVGDALLLAAGAVGLSDREATATIRSGLRSQVAA